MGTSVESRNSKAESPEKRANAAEPLTLPLLLEVGCEEIPGRFLNYAAEHLGEQLRKALLSNRLFLGPDGHPLFALADAPLVPLRTFFTPRRLVAYVPSVLASQFDIDHHIEGPPLKVAVDKDGKYTRAAEAFVTRNDAKLDDLKTKATPKGDYLELVKTDRGIPALDVLPKLLQALLWNLNFPKSMYWEQGAGAKFRFVRPIRWVLALLGEGEQARVVSFEIPGGVKASNATFGHRVKGNKPLFVSGFKDYMRKLKRAHVEIDPAGRARQIEAGLLHIEMGSLRLVPDEWLMDWAVNSTEWPRAMLGKFDERFLHMPREILITVMRDHQKYFALEDGQGNLRPHFVAVLNIDSDEKGLIQEGHERVLAARFRDAEFFWIADQRIPLRERFERGMLDRVTYHAQLGTYGDKVNRMLRIGRGLSALLLNQARLNQAGINEVESAIKLSKCDLTTQMVQEFPELQGVVGGLYANEQGESQSVAWAVADQYKPQGANDTCPRSLIGAVVALADKIDAVVCGFVAGVVPTGSSDPFGLRRQGNGFVRIAVEFCLPINVAPLVLDPIDALSHRDPTLIITTPKARSLANEIVAFIRERVGSHLGSVEGLPYDVVRAALGARESAWSLLENNPCSIAQRAHALNRVRDGQGFVKLCGAAKRIRNILAKSADSPDSLGWDFKERLFESEEEKNLGSVTQSVEQAARSLARDENFEAALSEMTRLVAPIDRFFEKVLVMSPDRPTRENRLRLLNRLNQMFSAVADLSQLVIS